MLTRRGHAIRNRAAVSLSGRPPVRVQYPAAMKLSPETVATLRSPVGRMAVALLGAATLVLVFQILHRLVVDAAASLQSPVR